MTWVKLDDQFDEHHVIVGLTDAAFRAYIEGLCYCSRNLSDGLIPHPIVKRRWHTRTVAELVAAGRWESWPEGYYVLGYLDHQRSRQQIEADKAGAAARAQKSRSKSRVTRTEVTQPDTEADTDTELTTPQSPPCDPLVGLQIAKDAMRTA